MRRNEQTGSVILRRLITPKDAIEPRVDDFDFQISQVGVTLRTLVSIGAVNINQEVSAARLVKRINKPVVSICLYTPANSAIERVANLRPSSGDGRVNGELDVVQREGVDIAVAAKLIG